MAYTTTLSPQSMNEGSPPFADKKTSRFLSRFTPEPRYPSGALEFMIISCNIKHSCLSITPYWQIWGVVKKGKFLRKNWRLLDEMENRATRRAINS